MLLVYIESFPSSTYRFMASKRNCKQSQEKKCFEDFTGKQMQTVAVKLKQPADETYVQL